MIRESVLSRLRATLRDVGGRRAAETVEDEDILDLCRALASSRGEASGVALATVILDRYQGLDETERNQFFTGLATEFDPDRGALMVAAKAYAEDPSDDALRRLAGAVEAPRQDVLRRLNQAPGGTAALVKMRADLLPLARADRDLKRVDTDFQHLLASWFNRGFLVCEPVTWATPASVLEKIIDYEAVHEIGSWGELRSRLQPDDRRCFAFFHPSMPGEPLVFVEVALTKGIPSSITRLLTNDRDGMTAEEADTAVFYSISNCQVGLRGVSFGHFLIKQVASDLARDLPNIKTFVTLSPAPGFAQWVETEAEKPGSDAAELRSIVGDAGWAVDRKARPRHEELAASLAAEYFLFAKRGDGNPLDPVARFHLGNGARLEQINPQANLSPTGMGRSLGVMVNYLYDLDQIEENHEAYVTAQKVTASKAVRRLAADPAERAES